MLQFGRPDPGVTYADRPAAFGLAVRDGALACVRVERGGASYHDLPGGAVDGEETEEQAVTREFLEETGLTIRPVRRIGAAAQRFRKSTGEAVNNRGGFWIAECLSLDPAAKCEEDHELVWLEPLRALTLLRHEAHAWAVMLWLRQNG